MSIPRKHHYVPQVHIRHFKSKKGYFIYLKESGKIIPQVNSSSFFYTKDLNSSINLSDDSVDHKSIENELSDLWDSKFNIHVNKLTEWLRKSIDNDCILTIPDDTLKYFFEYAIVGKLRRLKGEKKFNENAYSWLEAFDDIAEELELNETIKLKFPSDKIDFAKKYLKLVEDEFSAYSNIAKKKLRFPAKTPVSAYKFVPNNISIQVFIASEYTFLLPDTTSILIESYSTFSWNKIDVNKIFCIGLPITKNIFIQLINSDIGKNEKSDIFLMKPDRVLEINKKLFKNSISQVLSSDEEMFKFILEK